MIEKAKTQAQFARREMMGIGWKRNPSMDKTLAGFDHPVHGWRVYRQGPKAGGDWGSPSGKLAIGTETRHGRIELGKLENEWRFIVVSRQSFISEVAGEQLSPDEKLLAVPGERQGH
jgi:hypothetical protein